MTRKLTIPLALILLVVVVACGRGTVEAPQEGTATGSAQENLAPRPVDVVSPEPRLVTEEVQAIGSLTPFNEANVAADVEGVVSAVYVEVGRRVAAGDPLVDIDRTTFELLLAQAEANLVRARAQENLAQQELERKRQLLEERTISRAVFDTYEAQAKLASASVGAAEAARDLAVHSFAKSRAQAPFAGIVATRAVERGDRVGIGEQLYRIADTGRLKLVFSLPETYAKRIEKLLEVQFTAAGVPSTLTAKRWAVAPVVDRATRTVECTFVVDNPGGALPPGASASVTVSFPEKETHWVLPRAALTLEDLPRVFVIADGIARSQVVQVGGMDDTRVEVISGVDGSARVIADASGIFDGVPVAAKTGS